MEHTSTALPTVSKPLPMYSMPAVGAGTLPRPLNALQTTSGIPTIPAVPSVPSAIPSAPGAVVGGMTGGRLPGVSATLGPGGASGAGVSAGAGAGSGSGSAPGVAPSAAAGGLVLGGRGNGLEYAQMRKEKAREEYKERRRLELLASGDVERTKRRKKNDTTMTENQKYHRRLKMNQDSAAAARHAQEVYISTLENLVEVTENEKSVLSVQALNLKTERDDLLRRVQYLQEQLSTATAGGAGPRGERNEKAAAQAQHDLKTIFDILDQQGQAPPPEGFRQPTSTLQPTRAV